MLVAIFCTLEVLFVLKMRAGRRWARTVLTVLAVLSVLSNVASLLEGRGGFVLTGALVSLLLWPPRGSADVPP